MMSKHKKDMLFAMGALLLAAYLGFESFRYPAESALFPRVLSVLLAGLGAILLLRLLLKRKRVSAGKESVTEPTSITTEFDTLKSAGLVFGSIIVYGLMVMMINYEAATVLFLAAIIILLGFKRWAWTACISLGLTALLYAIFFKLLGVSRPESLFFQ